MSVFLFIIGLAFALGLGHWLVDRFLRWVRQKSGVKPNRPGAGVPNWIVGLFERILAFVIGFANVEAAYIILIAWMTAKLALNWKKAPANRESRVYGISALMAGTLSLGIAYGLGLLFRYLGA